MVKVKKKVKKKHENIVITEWLVSFKILTEMIFVTINNEKKQQNAKPKFTDNFQ